jgi:hypothetical protein
LTLLEGGMGRYWDEKRREYVFWGGIGGLRLIM